MTTELIPILEDNYVFLLEGPKGLVVVDPGDDAPVLRALNGRPLAGILLTHHHRDHVGGVDGLLSRFPGAVVVAPEAHRGHWRFATVFAGDGDVVEVAGLEFDVLALPGHTLDHVAYFHRQTLSLFSGDVLFGLGCGRLFEGTPEQAFGSLRRLAGLPPETRIYCTHEYTAANLRFLEKECPDLAASGEFRSWKRGFERLRAEGRPSVPLLLADELRFNPFLRAGSGEEFKDLRLRRNQFRA